MRTTMYFVDVDESVASYATVTDFIKIFIDEMPSLYLLSLLLTGDHVKAELCFICALEECVAEIGILRACMSSWARQAIIRHAIQLIMPVPWQVNGFSFIGLEAIEKLRENNYFGAIRALGAFERFVYIMTILEGWSEQKSALRLRCARRDVMMARVLALNWVAGVDAANSQGEKALCI